MAQSAKDEFERIFKNETEGQSSSDDGRFKNIKRLSFYPDTLPAWFFNPPQSSSNIVYAVGISDPDLTAEEAKRQALHRAKTMAVLFDRANVQYFRDIYSVEMSARGRTFQGNRFDTYLRISGSGYADSTCFSIQGHHFTRYNEALILIRYSPQVSEENKGTELLSAVGTALYVEASIGDAFEPQAEYEFLTLLRSTKTDEERAHFTYRERGNRFLSISEFMGQNHLFPLFNYRYANPFWIQNTPPLVSYNGLWSIYSKKLMRQLALNAEQSSIVIRTMGEGYGSSQRNLSREVATKTSRMIINGIEFGVDSIGFDIQVIDY